MVYNVVLKVLCSETVASRLQDCLNFFVVKLFLGLRYTKEDTDVIEEDTINHTYIYCDNQLSTDCEGNLLST